jgi:hypothetical protein
LEELKLSELLRPMEKIVEPLQLSVPGKSLGDDCPLDQLELELLLGIVTGLRDISLRVCLIISCF